MGNAGVEHAMKKTVNRWVAAVALASAVMAVVGTCVVRAWCERRREAAVVAERVAFLERFGIVSDGREPFVALPPCLPHGSQQADLGRAMFCERKLARTSRRTCAVCHSLNMGGSDGRVHGKYLTRPAMNAVFAPFYLHDGSVTNMEDLIRRMIEDPEFSGVESLDRAVLKLAADPQMLERFRAVYPDGLTATNVVDSIVQYSRTLMTGNMPFDAYCGGRTNALGAAQIRGMTLFRQRNCMSCHDGPVLGTLKISNGRKVPALRGISRRRAFLSDGSLNDLGAVLSRMEGGDLEDEERAALVSFLKAL